MTPRIAAAIRTLMLLVLMAGGAAPVGAAAPAADRVLPVDQHTTDKARRLATTHARALRELSATVYHCLPWLAVHKHSIGFYRPKGATRDERYLSMRVYIEQDASPQFARLTRDERAAAMFSRYVGPLLHRMAADRALVADASLDGFNLILDWMKPAPRPAGGQPVHETIAIFVPKSAAVDYLAGSLEVGQVADVARVLGWDGETALGQMKLTAWDDDFVATHKVANYELDKGVTCPR